MTHLYTLQCSMLFTAMVCVLTFLFGMCAGHWLVVLRQAQDKIRRDV